MPASRHFLQWLERSQGFKIARVDAETERQQLLVLALALRGELDQARAALSRLGEKVAIEYGFPPNRAVHHVEALLRVGVAGWWFDAEYPEAFKIYHAREAANQASLRERIEAFYCQVGAIAAHRPQIDRLFKGRIITTLKGEKQLAPEKIWALIARYHESRVSRGRRGSRRGRRRRRRGDS